MIRTRNIKVAELSNELFDNMCENILMQNCKAIVDAENKIKALYDDFTRPIEVHKIEDDSYVDKSVYMFYSCMHNGYYASDSYFQPEKYKEIYRLSQQCTDIFNPKVLYQFFLTSEYKTFLEYEVSIVEIKNKILSEKIDLSNETLISNAVKSYLDNCDYIRAHIQPYSSRWYLSDESQGHWDLWSETDSTVKESTDQPSNVVVSFEKGVIARNPRCDIKHNAVVGIDFGTKSTIVAVQNDNDDISLMRVGLADYSKAAEVFHYENPTVMEFVNLYKFLGGYNKKEGRPFTSWEDLKISHEAFKNMINSSKSMCLESFAFDLKQWAGGIRYIGDNGTLIIKDQTGYRYDINPFLKLTDEDINPIEIYAYYLGLFINNMHTGIYLDYVLSFPETYSLETKNAILKSFKKGIRKSIPESVFNDETNSEFRVRLGSSEPAAYAVCALESFGILPTSAGIKYGVFDFGGGTTDFDFGIWKTTPDDDYYYDKILKHFGAGGDKTLGGENILQLMAYCIFTDEKNIEVLRENKIVFVKPLGSTNIPGMEALIKFDESAILNTKQLIEVIRPIWEENEKYRTGIADESKFSIKYNEQSYLEFDGTNMSAVVAFFKENGEEKTLVTLSVDYEMLERVICERISKGISSFFNGMEDAFRNIDNDSPIHIFLAGNSSKSERVKRLFQENICRIDKSDVMKSETSDDTSAVSDDDDDTLELNGLDEIESDDIKEDNEDSENIQFKTTNFILYPPLGTNEAIMIQSKNGVISGTNPITAPTGKTGVAYGLIMCREGAGIKVESELKKTEQIKTAYYIGLNYRKHFKLIFDRTNEYNVWKKFNKALADMETFEFYYTQSSDVVMKNDIDISGNPVIFKKKCMVNKSVDGAYIFFKFTDPTHLEYVIADEQEIESEKYISNVYSIELE